MSGDLYAIGDIHGSLESLERLLDKINPDLTRDRLVFVGDYIDRGPQSREVVDYIIRLKNLAPPGQIICLKGNHEAMLLDFLAGGPAEMFIFNGGRATVEQYWGDRWVDREGLALPPDHAQFFQDLELYSETPDYLFVHGGLKPGVPLAEQAAERKRMQDQLARELSGTAPKAGALAQRYRLVAIQHRSATRTSTARRSLMPCES